MRQGAATPLDILETCLERARATEGLNCFVTSTEEAAREGAKALGLGGVPEGASKLYGMPIAIKDNFCTRGVRTTASSRMLETFIPPYTATCVERLVGAGGVIVGKTNMDEFGMGSGTLFSHFGATVSPWSPPGGDLR
jgi:aspartyl-tRNA(Asn)/glutamyl-tRNA(Gln) amidotransferase subunit A